jgi:hypothetical protein
MFFFLYSLKSKSYKKCAIELDFCNTLQYTSGRIRLIYVVQIRTLKETQPNGFLSALIFHVQLKKR